MSKTTDTEQSTNIYKLAEDFESLKQETNKLVNGLADFKQWMGEQYVKITSENKCKLDKLTQEYEEKLDKMHIKSHSDMAKQEVLHAREMRKVRERYEKQAKRDVQTKIEELNNDYGEAIKELSQQKIQLEEKLERMSRKLRKQIRDNINQNLIHGQEIEGQNGIKVHKKPIFKEAYWKRQKFENEFPSKMTLQQCRHSEKWKHCCVFFIMFYYFLIYN